MTCTGKPQTLQGWAAQGWEFRVFVSLSMATLGLITVRSIIDAIHLMAAGI